ncbi:uncharacterized protein TrAtP1_007554 [Trichoderma atroviride]|uniref:uncharacterized protein n=1 Tax=Hypocrea atroviridis TaxID=63577 RepID=UPI003320DD6C|nr:hypothetical protein TrAtP1_007554 [Trichoderma atroviride]
MRRHGILLVCAETAVAFRDKCGLLLIDPRLVLETQITCTGSIFRHQLRRRTKANSGHHFYPSSPPAAQRAKETPPPLVALSNCRALADAGWGSRNQGVALLHNTTCSKPQ